jgi:transposase, IS5 family
MHQTCKGKQWHFGMKVHIGVDKDSGLIHSVESTPANEYVLTPSSDLLHGEEEVIYADAGYQRIAKRPEMAGKSTAFRAVMRPGRRGPSPDTPDGRLEKLVEAGNAHIRAKVEHLFHVIKQQFGLQKNKLRGMNKNRFKVNVPAALTNLFVARRQLPLTS